MAKLPAFQFYPGDWMKDPALRSVSLAARGLWIDMLCLMHESDRRGYLQHSNGNAVTTEQVARMTGCTPEECARLLDELDHSGVYSRTEIGVIYSRRVVRDEEKRSVCVQAGRMGGNPTLKGGVKGWVKGGVKGGVKRHANPNPTPSSSSSTSASAPPQPPEGGKGRGADSLSDSDPEQDQPTDSAAQLAIRLGLTEQQAELGPSVPARDVLAHWVDVTRDKTVRSPGAVVAARARSGARPPPLTAKVLADAARKGWVRVINGVAVDGRRVGWNAEGVAIDGKVVARASEMELVEVE